MTTRATNYQDIAADYARHRRVHPGVLQELLALVDHHHAVKVLEVGCGSGNYVEAIQQATGQTVAGIDPSPAMLGQLRERLPDAAIREGTAEALPYADASFDLLYSVDVIHHVRQRDAFFCEAIRVLRPGGVICTVTDSEEDLLARVPLSSHFPETIPHEQRRYPTIGTLSAEMRAAGFTGLRDDHVILRYPLTDLSAFRNKAYSSLHLITPEEHAAGMARLEADLERGPIEALSLYTLLTGSKP